ncbi:hypothetical protein N7452_004116 [Penicillium brevicompactum]|uniref:Subtelomeric hrmA-associated cluster protein AFUB-079030/YDR124W-like helical bundle domain-containing protein n=1 Tax=Penicillium brevicompactum TaxID=5074 RepID=A0A9W9QUZ4_PENBR|nr:hypothetical protein N7452_004116 [Penicillium brevicompactum]
MSRKCDHDEMSAQHFAFIYIDCHGNLRREVSPSLYDKRDNILSAQVTARFLKAVAERREIYSPRPARLPAAHPLPQKQLSYAVHHPGFQEPTDADGIQNASSAQQGFMQPAVLETTLQHREKVGIQDLNISPHSTLITINESSYLRRYYKKVFQNLQQTNCRVIAKVFVKTVEPRKQVQYPYNGRKTVAGITQQLSPEETRPPWWPPGVTHREPDHLPKSERIALLVHILCELRLSHGITAQKLKVAQQPSRRLIEPMDRLRLLDEMYAVRDAEEKFLEGLTGGFPAIDHQPGLIISQDGKTTIPISKANLPDLLDTILFSRWEDFL